MTSPTTNEGEQALPRGRMRRVLMAFATLAGICFLAWLLFTLSPEVRIGVVQLLGRCGARGLSLIDPFLDDRDDHVRVAAMEVLGNAGEDAVSILVAALAYGDAEHCSVRIAILQRIGPSAKSAQPTLIDLVRAYPDEKVRRQAIETLGPVGVGSPESIDALIDTLHDPAAGIRIAGVDALGSLGNNASGSIHALNTALLVERDDKVRIRIVQALGNIGYDAESVQALERALQDPEPDIRAEAAESLGGFGPKAKAAVAALAKGLKDANAHVRQECAEALGKIGPEARAAIPDLQLAINDPDERVSRDAKSALDRIGN